MESVGPGERKRLGSGPACDGPPLEEHAWWRGALPGFDWDALLHRKLSPPALPWAGRPSIGARGSELWSGMALYDH